MYKYETHLHTWPVSACAHKTVRENLEFYKNEGYDGVFITNHFLDGNINLRYSMPYEESLDFYFSDYDKAVELSAEIGLKVFLGVELTYGGTDFLIYGLDKKWYYDHPEIMSMKKSDELKYIRENGGFVVQAHPFRQARYIDHIRLFPDATDGVEVINACRKDEENKMAELYASFYGFFKTGGTDNHLGSKISKLAGMESKTQINSEAEFIEAVKNNKMKIFYTDNK